MMKNKLGREKYKEKTQKAGCTYQGKNIRSEMEAGYPT